MSITPYTLSSSTNASIISKPVITLNDITVSERSTSNISKEPKHSFGTIIRLFVVSPKCLLDMIIVAV